MRLINVRTLRLEEFHGKNTPPYLILSHRWELEEVDFRDFHDEEARRRLLGWQKIKKFCAMTSEFGYRYAWIDTCCIDKSSSAELSEAINSMYRWYQKAHMCIAYLSDTYTEPEISRPFHSSAWFQRGWTLQELLAPRMILFYDRDWKFLGNMQKLAHEIQMTTRIDEKILTHKQDVQTASIAQRMSWAAIRKTTREEDWAYSLMGLFDVHMPLLYGEGETNAFQRLQLEILRQSDDESIFAWYHVGGPAGGKSGLLAGTPVSFYNSNVERIPVRSRKPYEFSNRGLRIEFVLFPHFPLGPQGGEVYAAKLNCKRVGESAFLNIHLVKKLDEDDVYCRVYPPLLIEPDLTNSKPVVRTVFVRQKDDQDRKRDRYFGWWDGWLPANWRTKHLTTHAASVWAEILDSPDHADLHGHLVAPPPLTSATMQYV